MTGAGVPMSRLLIINADDFGLTAGVCRGILRAHEAGVVTSTSALVVAPAYAAHAPRLADSGLSVGGHLAVVGEDPPLLTAREIPTLVDDSGRFPLRWRGFVARAARGAVDTDDIRREFAAQLHRLSEHHPRLTHLDSHQNLHLWPQVREVLIELATARGIGAVRMTRTARWTPTALGVRVLSGRLQRRARRAGLHLPGASAGLDEMGRLDRRGYLCAIARLSATGAATAELVTHLGEAPDVDLARYRAGDRWAEELAAACDPPVRAAIARAGFELGSYADLVERELGCRTAGEGSGTGGAGTGTAGLIPSRVRS